MFVEALMWILVVLVLIVVIPLAFFVWVFIVGMTIGVALLLSGVMLIVYGIGCLYGPVRKALKWFKRTAGVK